MQPAQLASYFEANYDTWCRFVAALLHLRADDPEVQNIVQEGVTNLIARGGGIGAIDETRPAPLFFAAIRNALRDNRRRRKHQQNYLQRQADEASDLLDARELEATPDELLSLREQVSESLREAVGRLTPPELQAVLLWLRCGSRGKAIAELGPLSDEEISNRYDQPLHRAKPKIRAHLGPLYHQAAQLGAENVLQLLREAAEWAVVEARAS